MGFEAATDQLPSRKFSPLVYGVGAWTDNLHFAYDLVAALRPRVFVELGTDRGESYFAFCQSVAENKIGTRCFAVDTWRGDEQAGEYDETTFAEVSAHNARYEGFSTLLRSTFDSARDRFAPETIDLLHLDGLHTDDAVRHDVESWLPTLRPGGIFLMHDVAVRDRGFGVWKVWEELRDRGRSYMFPEGAGLGVWQKPPVTPLASPIEELLSGDSGANGPLVDYYRSCARGLQQRIAEHWRDRTICDTAAAHQTIIQVFHSRDGAHREEDSLLARIGHERWKEVSIVLPRAAGAAPLRIDFVSAYTTVDVATIELACGDETLLRFPQATSFDRIRVAGNAERQSHADYLRLQITGPDPQLYLPAVELPVGAPATPLRLKLRVSRDEPAD